MVVVRAQWGRVAMFSDPLCLVLPSPFCSDVTGSTGHWPLHSPAPCCTVKGPDVLRNFVLLSWAPFSSSPRDDSFTHWDCGWVCVWGVSSAILPQGPYSLSSAKLSPPAPPLVTPLLRRLQSRFASPRWVQRQVQGLFVS